MPCWSLKLYFKVQISIIHTIVAGAIAVTSQLKENPKLNYKSLFKLQKVPKQITTYIKKPSDIMQIQLWFTPNSKTTAYVECCMLPLYSHQNCSCHRHGSCQCCSHGNAPPLQLPTAASCSTHNLDSSQYIILHYITLHYITLHYITLHYSSFITHHKLHFLYLFLLF